MAVNTGLGLVESTVDKFVDSHGDPWAADILPGAPWKITGIVTLYLLFVLKVGPDMMRNRKPLEIAGLMRVYNVLNVLANIVYVAAGLFYTNLTVNCWSCLGPHDSSRILMVYATFLYMGLKVFDLLDTVFFVLRKKDNQVTTLHLVHHSVMPFTAYFAIKITPCSSTVHTAILNSMVHVGMYSYYFLASYGPKMRKYLWWKSYITTLQIAQFVVLLVHSVTILLSECKKCNKFISVLQFVECFYFLYGFSCFYLKTYIKKCKAAKKRCR